MRFALIAVMRKELRQIFRDRRLAAILIVAPIVQLSLLGYAVDLEVDHLPLAVCDRDKSPESRALVAALVADNTLVYEADTRDPSAPLRSQKASVVVVIPPDFSRSIQKGSPVQVQMMIDGTNPIRSQVALNVARMHLQKQSLELAQQKAASMARLKGRVIAWPTIQIRERIFYNPRIKSPIYMVPAVAALTLLVVTTIATAMGLAREKEMGTIEQLLITPLHPLTLLLGKILPVAAIGLFTTGLLVAVGTHLFDVPIRGSLFTLFVGTILYLLNTLGAGILISTLARNQQQAILGGFIFILPAILLSGFASPIENIPSWLQPITWINPVRYFIEILRSTLLKGADLVDLWRPTLALLGFGVGLIGLATMRFRKRLG